MKFVPRQPEEGINVSDTHPLVEAGTLVVGLTAIFVILALAFVFLVELALHFVPVEKEVALFQDWLPEDLVAVSPDDNRLYQAQVLVDRLVFHWEDAPYEFRVEIDDSDVANAMALPGGLIIVTEGLLDQVESENELAFVLGHELGHFKNRDHLRSMGRGVVLSLLFAATLGGDISAIGINVTDLTLRGFSRKQETSADEFGLMLVHTHYGHVNEASRLFERWDENDSSRSGIASYLSTHPDSGDRVENLEAMALREGWPVQGTVTELKW